jgi:hypothetical protein
MYVKFRVKTWSFLKWVTAIQDQVLLAIEVIRPGLRRQDYDMSSPGLEKDW